MDNAALVNNIRKLCSEQDISISQLERELGMSPGLISRWNKNVPTLDRIMDIADYFNVPLDYITADSGPSSKEKTANRLILALYDRSINADLDWKIWFKDDSSTQIGARIDELLHTRNDHDYFYCSFEDGYFFLTINGLYTLESDISLYVLADESSDFIPYCSDTEKLGALYQYLYKRLHKQLSEIKTANLVSRFLEQSTPQKPKLDKITPLRPPGNVVNK